MIAQNCGRHSRYCANGDCIKSSEVCDGVVNCADGSDETSVACITTTCPRYLFRCAYGACVSMTAECNGVQVSANAIDRSINFPRSSSSNKNDLNVCKI